MFFIISNLKNYNKKKLDYQYNLYTIKIKGIKMENYIIYWAHLKEHKNPMSEGYIGITKNSLDKRKSKHISNSKTMKIKFYNFLKKYKDEIIWEVIDENKSKIMAQLIELILRPKLNIGWNSAIGGTYYKTYTRTEETLKKYSLARKGKKTKPRTEELKIKQSEFMKGNKFGKGYKHKEESIKIISEKLKGNTNRKGTKQTEEAKKLISESSKGRLHKEESKILISIKKRNKNIYKFIHEIYGIEICTMYELRIKYNLNHSHLSNIISGKRNIHKGWKIFL